MDAGDHFLQAITNKHAEAAASVRRVYRQKMGASGKFFGNSAFNPVLVYGREVQFVRD